MVVLLPDEAGWRSKDVRVFADEISFFNQVTTDIGKCRLLVHIYEPSARLLPMLIVDNFLRG